MMFKLKSLISRLRFWKKAPVLDSFDELEVKLMKATPKARKSFERDLRQKLRARHQELMEDRLEKQSSFFYVHRLGMSMALAFILVLGSGGVMVSAAGAPVPQNRSLTSISPDWHPDVSPITIDFDKNMMQGSVENSFSIYPEVDGSFVWEDRQTMHFLPDNPLDSDQQYVVKISQDAKSLFQKPISAEFEQKINVFSPELPVRIQNQITVLQDLRQTSKDLSGQQKDDMILRINKLEQELDLFFQENTRATSSPIKPQNITTEPSVTAQPKVEPSSA